MESSFPVGESGSAVDASGERVEVPLSPRRVVSLVPSVTETLFALGLGDRLVGVTEWCEHPADRVVSLPKVGGTKNPDQAAIDRLAPDLVLANLEENRAIDVKRMRERGLTVWVDFPRTVDDAVRQIAWLARLGASEAAARRLLDPIERRIELARSTSRARPLRGFIAIWRDPWMSVGRDTYAHDLLALVGIENVLAERAERYPRVTLEEVAALDPEIVLLPSEPYRFTDDDARALIASGPLANTSAARAGAIHSIDGTLPFWHGPRIERAIDVLGELVGRC